jgi:hypothetical protein
VRLVPHFLDNQFTDGGDVSLTRLPPFSLQEDSSYSFLLKGEQIPRAMVRLEGLGELKNPMIPSEIKRPSFQLLA